MAQRNIQLPGQGQGMPYHTLQHRLTTMALKLKHILTSERCGCIEQQGNAFIDGMLIKITKR